MKVLLRRNVSNLGKIGEVVEVKPGYARNYLLPQHLAVEPSPANLKAVEIEKKKHLDEMARLRKEVEARAKAVEGKEITITAKANEEGQLYGSVGPRDIAKALMAEGFTVHVDQVRMAEHLKRLDTVTVTVHLGDDIESQVKVWVVPEKTAADLVKDAATAEGHTGDANTHGDSATSDQAAS